MYECFSFNLPCCLTKSSLYTYYKDEVVQHVSETQFFQIWREELSHIKIPKMSRFTVCDTCARISQEQRYIYHTYYKDEVEQHVSETQFFRIWREELSHIKIPKMSRFTVCDTCARISRKMGEPQTKKEKTKVSLYQEAHLQKQNLERWKYYSQCSKANNYPNKYLPYYLNQCNVDANTRVTVIAFYNLQKVELKILTDQYPV